MQHKEILEILAEVKKRPSRFNAWERDFVRNLTQGVRMYGTDFTPSAKQIDILNRLSLKAFAT